MNTASWSNSRIGIDLCIIIIAIDSCLKALKTYMLVGYNLSSLSFYNSLGWVLSANPFLIWWFIKYLHLVASLSTNRKYAYNTHPSCRVTLQCMGTMTFQITRLTILYSTVYSGADQRKHQGSASLAFVRGIHRWQPVNSPHKWPVMRKCFHLMMSSWGKEMFCAACLTKFLWNWLWPHDIIVIMTI